MQIVLHMWKNRAPLLLGIEEGGIQQAIHTTTEQYERLILNHRPWWELLRMMKQTRLDAGLGLVVPRVFETPSSEPPQERSVCEPNCHSPPRSNKPPGSLPNQLPNSGVVGKAASNETGSLRRATNIASIHGQQEGVQGLPPNRPGSNDTYSSIQPLPQTTTSRSERPTKRLRTAQNNENMEDAYFYRPLTPVGSDSEGEGVSQGSPMRLRCHSQVSHQLHRLGGRVELLQPEEAHALEHLLEVIVGLQGTGNMARVVEALSSRVQVKSFYLSVQYHQLIIHALNSCLPTERREPTG